MGDRAMYDLYRQVWGELTAPGAQFEVFETRVRGHSIRAWRNAPANVRDLWLSSLQFGDRDYLVYDNERLTYAQTHERVNALAAWMLDQGVTAGDHVAIAMRNFPEWMQAYWAALLIGGVVVGMNAWWVSHEMAYGLRDAKPKVLVIDQERLDRLESVMGEIPPVQLLGVRLGTPYNKGINHITDFEDAVRAGKGKTLPDVGIDADSDATIFYTSGTTGYPKGAQLTHRGCVSNLMSLMFAGALQAGINAKKGLVVPGATPVIPSALITTPLFHVTANNCAAYTLTAAGGKMVHMYRWDAGEALRLIAKERITSMSGVPTMARELISHPDFANTDTSSLLSLGGGGAQLQPDLVHKIDKSVATARPSTGYGMTETCGIITSIGGDYFVDKADSCGPAMPVYETKIVDPEGREVPRGQAGELWVKGAHVIRGYLNRPEATASTITDGWLHTGDGARMDEDGFLYIVDRLKDMVIRGGENVYCAEVEAALFKHPAIAETTVFGVPDERLGEEVGAAVFFKAGQSATEDELRAHCGEYMAKHKVPRYIWFVNEPLPRNASGKFLKREVRDRFAKELNSA
jgi:long-chain acyl-CoA synthetase